MLVYPSGIDLSNSTLRYLSDLLRARRRERGTRRRRLSADRQALLALAHLRCGHTYTQLAAGFGIGLATVYRYISEAVEVLAALGPTLQQAMTVAANEAFVILDGTLLHIDRIAAGRRYYSGKHKCHGMNVQVIADAFGRLLWASPALPGLSTTSRPHAPTASRPHAPTASSKRSPKPASGRGQTRVSAGTPSASEAGSSRWRRSTRPHPATASSANSCGNARGRARIAIRSGNRSSHDDFTRPGALAHHAQRPESRKITGIASSAQQARLAPSRRPARTLAAPAASPSTSGTRTSGRHAESTLPPSSRLRSRRGEADAAAP